MTRLVPGGRKRILDLIELAASFDYPDAVKFWEVYDALKEWEKKKVSFDDVCEAAAVHASDLLGAIVTVGCRQGEDVSSITESALRPQVVHQLARSALRIHKGRKVAKDGKILDPGLSDKELDIAHKDRLTFLQHSGFAPVPKAAVMRVSVNAHAGATAQAAAVANAEPSVPSFAADMQSLERPKQRVQDAIIAEPLEGEE